MSIKNWSKFNLLFISTILFFHLSHAIAIVSQNVSTIKGKEAKNGMEAKL
jgi:hypothetical protein